MDDQTMVKARTTNTNKLHFVIPYAGKIFKIRAGCLVLRDFDGNCLMTKEPKLSKGRNVIGFCGGTVEEHDRNIIDTVIREAYEECVLSDNLSKTWSSDWITIQTRIMHAPTNLDEIIFNHIYTICKNKQMVYVDGHNSDLKSMYFQVHLPKLYSDYLVGKYDLQVISVQMFDVMSKLRDTQSIRYCLKFGIPSCKVGDLHFRLREIMISSPKFCKFLQCGLSKVDYEPVCRDILSIAQNSYWYQFCKIGQTRIQACLKEDPIVRDACIMLSILMSKQDWQQIFDLWYFKDQIDHGMAVLNLVNHFLYGSLVSNELVEKSNILKEILRT